MGGWNLPSNAFFALGVAPQQVDTNAATAGVGVPIDGFNFAHALVMAGSALDSDASLTITFQKNIVTNVASDAASSDWSAIGTATYSITFTDTTSSVIRLYWLDLVKIGMSTGLLRASTTVSVADTAQLSVAWIFTKASQRLPDSDNPTITEIAT